MTYCYCVYESLRLTVNLTVFFWVYVNNFCGCCGRKCVPVSIKSLVKLIVYM